jgi:GT2 family glycosyltransferase
VSHRTTVIVLNWNGRDLLEECLSSLAAQTDQDFETLVVDNGSTDGSVDFVRANFPKVRIMALPENYGFAKGNNIGMRAVRTERIALLNNDTRVDPAWLEKLNAAMDAHDDVGLCASKMLNYFHPDMIDTAGDELGVALAFKRGMGERDNGDYSTSCFVFGACAGAALYRKRLLDQVGLFDESFVTNYEDVDLSFRAQLAGYRCLYVPDAIVYHKVGETKRRSGWTRVQSHRNRILLWLANAPSDLIAKYASALILREATILLYAAGFRRRSLAKPDADGLRVLLRSYSLVLRGLPEAMRKRREVQSRRVVTSKYLESLMRPTRWSGNHAKI